MNTADSIPFGIAIDIGIVLPTDKWNLIFSFPSDLTPCIPSPVREGKICSGTWLPMPELTGMNTSPGGEVTEAVTAEGWGQNDIQIRENSFPNLLSPL